jgi:hypothetical protein
MGLISVMSLTKCGEMLKISAHETLKNRGSK